MSKTKEKVVEVKKTTSKGRKVISKKGSKIFVRPDGYTSDIVVFAKSLEKDTLKIVLIQRRDKDSDGNPNIEGEKWALPGGFVNPYEASIDAAKRELKEETGIKNLKLTHFGVYDGRGRDPRGWIISSAHYAVVNEEQLSSRRAGDDAKKVKLFGIDEALTLSLAFDHKRIIIDALKEAKVFNNIVISK